MSRKFKCNACGEKFKSTNRIQDLFGQVDESGIPLDGVGICHDCYKRDKAFKNILETNLENAVNAHFENEEEIRKELTEEGYE